MGVKKIRTSLQVAGDLTVGQQLESPTLTTPTITGPTITGGVLNMKDGTVRVGTVAAALGTSNLATEDAGLVRVGFSGGTLQVGVVLNGTAFILAGTPGGALGLSAAS